MVSAASSIITKEYVCKHLKHQFPRQVPYSCFVEQEKDSGHYHQENLARNIYRHQFC